MEILNALSNIGFDWRVALANLVNFLIVFYLLKRFVFGPLAGTMTARKEKIAEGLENAQKAETSLMQAEESKKEIISEARTEANDIVAGGREQEREIVAAAAEKAHSEAEKITADARARAEEERVTLRGEVEREAAGLVVEGVRALLKEEVSADKSEAIMKKVMTASS